MSAALDIRGAGAGGGKSDQSLGQNRAPIEASDTLRSRSYAQVLDLIAEGEIEGLVNGLQSVYLDGVPIQNEDGTLNFSGVSVQTRNGTQDQSRLSGLTGVASEHAVNVEVVAATPIIRAVTNPEVDAVRVRLAIPGLSKQDVKTGDLTGSSVQVAIDVQSNGGGYVAQPIGRTLQTSPNPAVTAADALQITVEWRYQAGVKPGFQYTERSFVKYEIQYRQVGAPTWTTYKADSMGSSDIFPNLTTFIFRRGGNRWPTRSYALTGLPNLLYEARVVKTAGLGSMVLTRLAIGVPVPYDTIVGKTTSTYHRSYRINLTGDPPWDIRVRRLTADSGSVTLRNKTYWDSYTELIDERFRYPNSALVGLKIDSSQFSTVPTRGYDMKLLRVKIPSNYDPISRVYTGVWDGTFTVAWTDNPAWCFYDLMTNTRYGLAKFAAGIQVDKWALYAIGQYCDELVPDGYGHEEPRYTCNLYFQTSEEAFTVMTKMASIFRGMVYAQTGSVTAVQDSPSDPVFLFTEANVEGGLFSYTGSALSARHTTVTVRWNDPDDGYRQKPEYVEDRAGILRYGIRNVDVVAVGCASRGQARRVGEWLLYSELYDTELIKFRCGQDGVYLRPGNVFAVQDQHRAGVRFGGRILAATSTTVNLDHAVTLSALETYQLKVVLPDGTIQTKTVTTGAGSASTLTVDAAWTAVPLTGAVWVLTSTGLAPRLYRAITIVEVDRHRYEVTGLAHNASKYAYIERDQPLEVPDYSAVSAVPSAPQNVEATESLVIRGGVAIAVVTLTWDAVETASRYRVSWRRNEGNYVTLPETATASAEIVDAIPGTYEFRVVAVNLLQAASPAGTLTREIFGKTAAPSNVTGFVVARTDDELLFAWQDVPDLDLDYYEVRHGATWEVGVQIARTVDTRMRVRTTLGGTYLIKAVDTSGKESITAAAIIIGAYADINVVVTDDEGPAWAGVTVQTAADSTGVTLAGQHTWADLTQPWSSYTQSWIVTSDPYDSGTYETVPSDLSQVMTSRVEVLPVVQQVNISGQAWDDLTQPWTSYTDPWTGTPGAVSATYEMALSQNGTTWTAWQTYQAGHYVARAYKFRITLTTNDPDNYLPKLTAFTVTVDVPDRVLHFEDVATSASGTTLTFSPAFVNVQTVTGTIQAGAIGDTFRVTGKSNSQATVTVYDSAGAAKTGLVDIDVFGYGSI